MEIRNENFVVIHGWMVNTLGLSGNELIIYALVYGFSQDGKSCFQGSAGYAGAWCGISRQSASANLKKLVDQKLIEKEQIRGIGDRYRVSRKLTPTCQETLHPPVKKLDTTCQETLHNNISNIADNINNMETPEKKGITKEIYTEIDTVYIDLYREVKSGEPTILYPALRKRQKTLLENGITKEKIISAIKEAKHDTWIVQNGFDILMILSDKVFTRLVNNSRYAIPSKPSCPKKIVTCPRCGAEVIAGLCTKCRTPVDSEGKELK